MEAKKEYKCQWVHKISMNEPCVGFCGMKECKKELKKINKNR